MLLSHMTVSQGNTEEAASYLFQYMGGEAMNM
jgi:hypothetical protein